MEVLGEGWQNMTNNRECLHENLGFYLKYYSRKIWETAIDTLEIITIFLKSGKIH